MDTQHLVFRVRPQRLALLLPEKTTTEQFVLAIQFLSSIWGGQYCPLLPVTVSDDGKATQQSLARIRPDVVCGIGIDDALLSRLSQDCSQSRGYINITPNELGNIHKMINPAQLIPAHCIAKSERDRFPDLQRNNMYFHGIDPSSPLAPFVFATFGFVPGNDAVGYGKYLHAKVITIPTTVTYQQHLDACVEMARRVSWLDFASSGLSAHILRGAVFPPPTIILVKDVPTDLQLLWNLRATIEAGFSGRCVAFPLTEMDNADSVDGLVKWVKATPVDSNYCVISSRSCPATDCHRLARLLRLRLKQSKIRYVDVCEEAPDLPVVVPCERETVQRVYCDGVAITFDTPMPSCHEHTSFGVWMCDITKDLKTGRLPFELFMPPRHSAMEVLNAPHPPYVSSGVPRLGFGVDSMNVRCNKRDSPLTIHAPTADELLEEMLDDHHIAVTPDEKRACYCRAIELCGGLQQASEIFTGTPLRILESLVSGSLTHDEIKSAAKLGKDKRQSPTSPMLVFLERSLSPRALRLAKRRFAPLWQEWSDGANSIDILERLGQQGLIGRQWRIDKCRVCGHVYWVGQLDVKASFHCPGCNQSARLGDKISLGYAINPLIATAIREGIVSVVRSSHFLLGLTHDAYMWLPGVKYSYGRRHGDLDIFACCDGHLVGAECKTLIDGASRRTWNDILEQVTHSVDMCVVVGASLFVLATMCDSYPQHFERTIKSMAGGKLGLLLLNKKDLETGYRKLPAKDGQTRRMTLDDVLPKTRVPQKRLLRRRIGRMLSF